MLLKAVDTEDLSACWEGKIEGLGWREGVASSYPRESLQIVRGGGWRQGFPTWFKWARGYSELTSFPRFKPLLDPESPISTKMVQDDLGSGTFSPLHLQC